MPRYARVVLPNHPHHIVQRGHNRDVVFAEDADFLFYLENLAQCKANLGCVMSAIPDGEWQLIRVAVQRGQLTGSPRFADEVERRIGRRIELRGPGRPHKRRQ